MSLPKLQAGPITGVSHLSHPVCELADEVIRLGARMKRLFSEATASSGMSPMAYTVFIYIAEAHAPPTVPQIGRTLGHVRQVIQRAANELVAAGLVVELDNPHHKTARLLQLSAKGEAFKRQSDERVMAIGDDVLKHIERERFERAVAGLGRLRGEIEAYLRLSDREQAREPGTSRPAAD